MGRIANISTHYLVYLFKKETGASCREYVIQVRMRRACDLLKHTDYTVSEISRQVGYDDPYYFCRLFRKKTGMPPTQYRIKGA